MILGALGEVGRHVSDAFERLGSDVIRVSSRTAVRERGIIDLESALTMIRRGQVEVVVNASGRGDRRELDRSPQPISERVASACEEAGITGVLLSTSRVLESYSDPCPEWSPARCHTPYATANAANEDVWRRAAPVHGMVLRITNFFGAPQFVNSPQSQLLPWSLVMQAWESRAMGVRSNPQTKREFVSALDVVHAVNVVSQAPPPERICVTAPGLVLDLAALVTLVQRACRDASLPVPSVTFGNEESLSQAHMTGWLAERGWVSTLTPGEITRVITRWLMTEHLD